MDTVESLCGQALWTNYRKDLEEMEPDELEEFEIPILDAPEDIWKLVTCRSIMFPSEYCDFQVSFVVPWDEEHGCTVFFKDLQVILVE